MEKHKLDEDFMCMVEAEDGDYYRTDEVDANMVSYAFYTEVMENKDAEIATLKKVVYHDTIEAGINEQTIAQLVTYLEEGVRAKEFNKWAKGAILLINQYKEK